jgi:hypothetical protein
LVVEREEEDGVIGFEGAAIANEEAGMGDWGDDCDDDDVIPLRMMESRRR